MPIEEAKLRHLPGVSGGRGPPWPVTTGPPAHWASIAGSAVTQLRTRVARSEATMSKLACALILAGTVAALSLTGTAAVAQPNDQDTTSQRELADNWNYYSQATRVPPAELKARMRAEATQRVLAERWSHYSHATQMSPAELEAWLQARDRADPSAAPPSRVHAPVQRTEPSGQPAWLVVSLGGLAAAMTLVAGLAVRSARRANRRARAEQPA
jgi:hypothetical protein